MSIIMFVLMVARTLLVDVDVLHTQTNTRTHIEARLAARVRRGFDPRCGAQST